MTRKKERTERNEKALKVLQVPPSKNICRGKDGREDSERKKEEKAKQAFYNFKEKEAVEWTGENIYSGN